MLDCVVVKKNLLSIIVCVRDVMTVQKLFVSLLFSRSALLVSGLILWLRGAVRVYHLVVKERWSLDNLTSRGLF